MKKPIVLDTCAFPTNIKSNDKKFDINKYNLVLNDSSNEIYITPFTLLELLLNKDVSIQDIAITLRENNINILCYEKIIFKTNSMIEIQNNIDRIYEVTFLYIKKFIANLIDNYLITILSDETPDMLMEVLYKIRNLFNEIYLDKVEFKKFICNDFIKESFSKILVLLENKLNKKYTWDSFRNVIFSPLKNSINTTFLKVDDEYKTFLKYLQEDCCNKPHKLINNVIDYLNLHSCVQLSEKFIFITRDRKLYKHAIDMKDNLKIDVEIIDTFDCFK